MITVRDPSLSLSLSSPLLSSSISSKPLLKAATAIVIFHAARFEAAMEMEEEKVATDKRILVMVLPHPLIKHWSFVLRNEQTSSTIFEDDVTFKLEYVHPYLDGVQNPRNRTFRASCVNSRKMSPIFISGPDADEVPPVWIDRAGIKGIITESSLKP